MPGDSGERVARSHREWDASALPRDPVAGGMGMSASGGADAAEARVLARTGSGRAGRMLAPVGFGVLAVVVAVAWTQAAIGFGSAVATPCLEDRPCLAPRLTPAAMDELIHNGFGVAGYVAAALLLVFVGFAVPFSLGILVAVRGAGVRRWAIGALWVAMAFGGITAYSAWPWARFTIVPLGTMGWYWLVALFPTMTLIPRWAAIPALAASGWAVVTWGIPPVVEAIATQQAPWYQLVGPGFLLCVAALLVAQVVRFRRSGAEARRAQGQLVVGLAIVLGGGVIGALLTLRPDIWGYGTVPGGLFALLSSLGSVVSMIVIAGAGLRDRVYVIGSVVDNVLVAGVLVVIVGLVHVAAVVIASLAFRDVVAVTLSAVLAALAAALVFTPVRRGIERLVFGDLNAESVVAALTSRVARASTGEQVLADAVDELCRRMRWPGARFTAADRTRTATALLNLPDGQDVQVTSEAGPVTELATGSARAGRGTLSPDSPERWHDAQPAASSDGRGGFRPAPNTAERRTYSASLPGSRIGTTLDELATGNGRMASVPLGEAGELEVMLRPGQRRLTRRDRQILDAAAGSFAVAVSVARLTETAEAARRETLTVREGERLSLRRRLHDGVGPSLAVARHLLQGVRDDLPIDAAEQRALGAAEAAVADGLAQVRQISRELRPPGLDDAGFAEGLIATAADLGLTASVTAEAVRGLPDHPRAELYRIAVEAIVNAQRHGAARAVEIAVERQDGGVRMTVDDDGTGLAPEAAPGVGIAAMRERAVALDGLLRVCPRTPRGTRVEVDLPDAAVSLGVGR